MSSASVCQVGDREGWLDLPSGRILSATDFAGLVATERRRRGTVEKSVGQLPSLHDQAWQHGYQQGLCHAMLEVKSTLAELRACQHDRDSWMHQFVFAVVRKVLGNNEAASLVPLIVQQVIEECDRSLETIVLHVHPSVTSAVARRLASIAGPGLQLDVVADERLMEGDCELHTPFGIIDAGLDTQLDALEHAIRAASSVATDG